MINEQQAKRYCNESILNIENYDKAIADTENVWDLHHRIEIQGQFRNSQKLLIKCGMYYKVPASQLIFMTHTEHTRLHNKGRRHTEEHRRKNSEAHKGEKNSRFGKRLSSDTRRKMSEAHKGIETWSKGKHLSEETKRKLSVANKGRRHTEEARRKMSEAHKGREPWNKGKYKAN